jgi:hypothetical protein
MRGARFLSPAEVVGSSQTDISPSIPRYQLISSSDKSATTNKFTMSTLTQFFKDSPRNVPLVIGTSVVSTIAVITLAKLTLRSPPKPKLIPSPRETLLPKITKEEQSQLSYPPDLFPGARDVTSPASQVKSRINTNPNPCS